jgi:prophage tail gpP-like protein
MAFDPQLIAKLVAAGGEYTTWKSVEMSRMFGEYVSYMRFSAVEPMVGRASKVFQLVPGDEAKGYLAGRLVVSGNVTLRQASYDAKNRGITIIVAAHGQNVVAATVGNKPGQYINQTFQQIAAAVCGKVGVGVTVRSCPGSDIPFPRISEQPGETIAAFVTRLAMHRNLHVVDNPSGNLIFGRGSGSSGASLVEGGNILEARLTLDDQYADAQMYLNGQDTGGSADGAAGTAASEVTATDTNPLAPGRPKTVIPQLPVQPNTAKLYLHHEVNLDQLQQVEGRITVPGWFAPSGDLWIAYVEDGAVVGVDSPSLLPDRIRNEPFRIKGVRHVQDDQHGTHTEIIITNAAGLQGADTLSSPGPMSSGTTGTTNPAGL